MVNRFDVKLQDSRPNVSDCYLLLVYKWSFVYVQALGELEEPLWT